VDNTAKATGSAPDDSAIESNESSAELTATADPALTLAKSADKTTLVAGQTVTYSFLVTNSGNVTVKALTINDLTFTGSGSLSAITCPDTVLAPDDATTCTATYLVTQADVDAGSVANTATASGTDPKDDPVVSNESGVTIQAQQDPALTLLKTADKTTLVAGQTVTYTFDVTNSGNVTVRNLAIREDAFTGSPSISNAQCVATTLDPGASTTCTATYLVTLADVNAGTLGNTATATGVDPNDDPVESNPSSVTLTAVQASALSLEKSADTDTLIADQTITYSFLVTNTGNVTVSGVQINEIAFDGSGSMSSPIYCLATTLDPDASTTCTATYVVSQADVDAGSITNTATASGTDPKDQPVTSNESFVTIDADQRPDISLVKSADPSTELPVVGDDVTYSFVIHNTGNVTLHDVGLTEDAFSGAGAMSAFDCGGVTTLAPGTQVICTATYTVQQADADAGTLTNTATVTGTTPTDGHVADTDSAQVPATPDPALSLLKSADQTVLVEGVTVTYSFLVTNTGNVTIHNVAIAEGTFTGSGTMSAATCPQPILVPGAQETCTAAYVPTQADIDAGSVTNTATATGKAPDGSDVVSPPSSVTLDADQQPSLSLDKSADRTTLVAGQTVTYSFLVTNTGNVTIHGLAIAEGAFTGSGTMTAATCPLTTLAPQATTTCTATYLVTQADVDAGSLHNEATATGKDPTGDDVTSPMDEVTIDADPLPGISLVKSADAVGALPAVGATVTYTFVVTNTGNVTLHDVTVAEDSFSGAGTMSAIDCAGVTTLAPQAQATCHATYVVQQADIDSGLLSNAATATGTDPNDEDVSDADSNQIPQDPNPALTLVKSASIATLVTGGMTYSFLVTNTGNVTIHNVAIAEGAFDGAGTLSAATCPVTTLLPGEHTTCTATYTVLQADVDAGSVTNTATATGTDPTGDDVTSPPGSVTLEADQVPALSLVKAADPTTIQAAGEKIAYSFLVTNTGNVTVDAIAIDEVSFTGSQAMSAIACPVTTLAPAESTTCTATYTANQADMNAGRIDNTAAATGTDPNGDPVRSKTASASVIVDQVPALALVKSADRTALVAGQTVTYSFLVTNVGNVTVTHLSIADDPFTGHGAIAPIHCPVTTLQPGDKTTCTTTYVVTQEDVDAGQVDNTAVASGLDPAGDEVDSQPSSVSIKTDVAAGLTLVKTADEATLTAGTMVTFHFLATNTGNVTITGLTILEGTFTGSGQLSAVTCPVDALAPGASTICGATYLVTQADVDAGSVVNTATASGKDPKGDPVGSKESKVKIDSDPKPSLDLLKTADTTDLVAGKTITYTFAVTNDGNVTVTGLHIDDAKFTGAGKMSDITCTATTLAPKQSTTCTATYVPTQEDVDSGALVNTAVAVGAAPDGSAVTSPESTVTLKTGSVIPSLGLTKTVDASRLTKAGDSLPYTFTVTNTGEVTVTDLFINDPGPVNGSGEMSTVTCEKTTLAPGESTTCTGDYTVTQDDIDANQMLVNVATATGAARFARGTSGEVDSPPAEADAPVPPKPVLTLVKSADVPEVVAGEKITYTFLVTNEGNVTAHDVRIDEGAFTGSGTLSQAVCPTDTLDPGEHMTCTATYTPNQADVNAGGVTNTATASGTTPYGVRFHSKPSTVDLPSNPAPSLGLTKKANLETVKAGQTVTYTFVLTNLGNVTLTDLAVQEVAFSGTGTLSAVKCPVTRLAPDASVTCTATYVVTAADVEAGALDNTATATGKAPDGSKTTSQKAKAHIGATKSETKTPLGGSVVVPAGSGGGTAGVPLVGGGLAVVPVAWRRRLA